MRGGFLSQLLVVLTRATRGLEFQEGLLEVASFVDPRSLDKGANGERAVIVVVVSSVNHSQRLSKHELT